MDFTNRVAPKVPTACACGGYALDGGRKCAKCLEAEKKTPHASKFDARKQWKHLYSKSRWRNTVQPAVLRRDPICTVCHRRPSTVADHIRDHRGDEKLFWDMANLAGKCGPCHDEKTGTEHGFGRQSNLPPQPTPVPEPGPVPSNVDFIALLNLDPKTRKG